MITTIAKWFKCLGCKRLMTVDFAKKETEKTIKCSCGKHSVVIK